MEASRSVGSRFVGLAAVRGAAGGVVMAMWMMIYSGCAIISSIIILASER